MDAAAVDLTETNGPMVTGVVIGFTTASFLFLVSRFYTRLVLLSNTGKDDWTILTASVLSLIVTISTGYEVKYGMGRHQETVGAEEGIEQLKFLMISVLCYNMGMNVIKVSFLFQYRRIFSQSGVQKICFWVMLFVCTWACVQAVLLSLTCLPIAYIQPSTAKICLNTLPIWYFSSAMSTLLDIVIFCIPLPAVYKLQLPLKQKIMLLGIFSLGFFVCIISVYRMFSLHSAVYSTDPSWENFGAAIWSSIELNISIIASCLPTIRPLLARLLPGAGLSSARNDRSTYLRYGSASAGLRSKDNNNKKRTATRSISTEELALGEMPASPVDIIPASYAGASADRKHHVVWDNEKQIMVTTVTSIEKR